MAEEDLEPGRMNSSNDFKIMLYKQGYLQVKKRGESYTTLEFHHNSDYKLYADLVWVAPLEDHTCGEALYTIISILQRMPPEIDDFKSLMLTLDTILSRIPQALFKDWEVRAIFGTFYSCGLKLEIGNTPLDRQIIYCDNSANNTIMRIVVGDGRNAKDAWDNYYGDLLLPGLINSPRVNLLAIIIIFSDRFEKSNSTIRDWYGVFETPKREILREYRPSPKR